MLECLLEIPHGSPTSHLPLPHPSSLWLVMVMAGRTGLEYIFIDDAAGMGRVWRFRTHETILLGNQFRRFGDSLRSSSGEHLGRLSYTASASSLCLASCSLSFLRRLLHRRGVLAAMTYHLPLPKPKDACLEAAADVSSGRVFAISHGLVAISFIFIYGFFMSLGFLALCGRQALAWKCQS